jgi:hypothetical protein
LIVQVQKMIFSTGVSSKYTQNGLCRNLNPFVLPLSR